MTEPLPGWYPEPSGTADERWWDGTRWTGNVRPAAASVVPAASSGPYGSYGSTGPASSATPGGLVHNDGFAVAPSAQINGQHSGAGSSQLYGEQGGPGSGPLFGQPGDPSGHPSAGGPHFGATPAGGAPFGGAYGQNDATYPNAGGYGGYGQPTPAAVPTTLVQRNKLSLIAAGVMAIYVVLAFTVGIVFFGILPILFAVRAIRAREPLAVPVMVLAALALLVSFVRLI